MFRIKLCNQQIISLFCRPVLYLPVNLSAVCPIDSFIAGSTVDCQFFCSVFQQETFSNPHIVHLYFHIPVLSFVLVPDSPYV